MEMYALESNELVVPSNGLGHEADAVGVVHDDDCKGLRFGNVQQADAWKVETEDVVVNAAVAAACSVQGAHTDQQYMQIAYRLAQM